MNWIKRIREWMYVTGVYAYLITGLDPHLTEYQPKQWRTRESVSSFTGSAGSIIITPEFCGLWTDFRYYIQAEQEIDLNQITLFKDGLNDTPKIEDWLVTNLKANSLISFDSRTLSYNFFKRIDHALKSKNVTYIHDEVCLQSIVESNSSDAQKVFLENWNKKNITGLISSEKIELIRSFIKEKKISAFFFSSLDEIAWILNLRGSDIPFNPLFFSYLFISEDNVDFFCDITSLSTDIIADLDSCSITVHNYDDVEQVLPTKNVTTIGLDFSLTSYYWIKYIEKLFTVLNISSPANFLKSIKNKTEIKHIKKCMIHDALILHNFEKHIKSTNNLDEFKAANCLSSIRSKAHGFYMESFPPIVAYKDNAAICHYQSREKDSRNIIGQGLLLVDSGSHYRYGTTDITRVFAIGEPDENQIESYTLVLKAHIKLATAQFPHGTTGAQLDAIGRDVLWRHHLNFGHGTGHGVGFGLMVHENPPRISPLAKDSVIREGMVFSNEPGLYFENNFGIRIENLVTVVKHGNFLALETLTLYPFEHKLINFNLLSNEELLWLKEYYLKIIKTVDKCIGDRIKKECKNYIAL